MSQSVERLKELLFDSESQALSELTRRLEGLTEASASTRDGLTRRIDSIAEIDARAREELTTKLEEVYAHAGDTERLTASVSNILSEALRRAEVAKHSDLSQSIAPLIVTTIKTELRNSQDEMVEALYPITGRLVKSYVASAIKDLTDQMNRRLEQNPVMLRLQSLTTGKSVAELALAGGRDFDVKELYLIRRGSGELVAHWPDHPIGGREQAMSGVLTAVNEFANEAFSADQGSLRNIDLGGEEVYLRASPVYLLAARCSGLAPKAIEQTLDDAFLSAVETQHNIDARALPSADASKAKASALANVGQALKKNVAADLDDLRRPGGKGALKVLAALILLPLLGWLGWGFYVDYRMATVRSTAERIIEADPAMLGYPVQIDVASLGRSLIVSGLTPSQQAKTRIVNDLQTSLPNVTLQDGLTVVAGSDITVPDVSPEFARVRKDIEAAAGRLARAALTRVNIRIASRLKQAAIDLTRAAATAPNSAEADAIKGAITEVQNIVTDMKPLSAAVAASAAADQDKNSAIIYQALSRRLQSASDAVLQAGGGGGGEPKSEPALPQAGDVPPLDAAIEQLSADTEHIAALAATRAIANSMRPPAPVQQGVQQATPHERLEAFARSHAIFFTNNLDYRNTETEKWLSELAQLLKETKAVVRIVGYTDEVGAPNRNVQLANDRAEKVRGEMIALGVPPAQLLTVARASANDLSDKRGAGSPNRRVEFELGFEGEVAP